MNVEYFSTLKEYEKWLMYMEQNIEIQSVFYNKKDGCTIEYIIKEGRD